MRSTTEIKSKTMTLDEAIKYCEEVATKNCLEYVEEQQTACKLVTHAKVFRRKCSYADIQKKARLVKSKQNTTV